MRVKSLYVMIESPDKKKERYSNQIPYLNTVAIIPAGGAGHRMQGHTAKQYLHLNHLPLLVHTLRRFQISPIIQAIYLVVPPEDQDTVRISIVDRHGLSKVVKILPGGQERQDSVRNAVEALDGDVKIVMVHDAVRPFISEGLIRQIVAEAAAEGAAIVAVPAKDTVKICDEANRVIHTPDRGRVWLTQTPQAFRREIIVHAYEAAYRENFYGTDDAGLVERTGVAVKVIPGTYDNIKITTPDDLVLAEVLMKKKEWSS